MVHMRIALYSNLNEALETLKENEYFYTHSLINTLRIRYKHKRASKEYEPVSVAKSKNPFKHERYEHFLFRKDVIEDLIRGTISVVENNSEVFKPPLKEAITIGLEEFYTKIKDKEFICVGSAEPLYPRGDIVRKLDNLNEPILASMTEEKWRESFLSLGNVKERVEEKITEIIIKVKGLKPGSNYQDYYWDEYSWIDVISLVDKELVNGKGRVIAKFWENGRVLGVNKLANTLLSEWELESVSELKSIIQENIEKLGTKYVKENFSKIVLGGICLYLSELNGPEQTEVVLVPFKITGENEKGDKEVEFLFLARLKIGDKAFSWMPVSIDYDNGKFNRPDAIKRGTRKLMRVVDKEKMPVELSKEKGKVVFINTSLGEKVSVSEKQYDEGKKIG